MIPPPTRDVHHVRDTCLESVCNTTFTWTSTSKMQVEYAPTRVTRAFHEDQAGMLHENLTPRPKKR